MSSVSSIILVISEIAFFLGSAISAVIVCYGVYERKKGIMPFQQGFFCADHSIMKPYDQSKEMFSFFDVIKVGVSVSLAMIIAIEMEQYILERRRKYTEDVYSKQNDNVKCGPLKIPPWIIRLLYDMLVFGSATSLLQLVIAVIKVVYGRLRPYFLTVCKPNAKLFNCSDGYITRDVCTGDPLQVKKARMSMPSGHTANAMFFAVFVVLCIQALVCLRKYKITRITFQVGFLLLASAVAVQRVTLNAHYTSDVIAGLVIGAFFAWFLGAKVMKLSKRIKTTSPTEYRQISASSNMMDDP